MQTLGLITLLVPDYDHAIAFWCGTMGWHLREDRDEGHKRWVVVAPAAGGAGLVLARPGSDAERAALGRQTGGRVGFFLETDDFRRDHARMIDAGVVFEEAPRVEPYGTVAVFRDPWGNRWDLLERRR